MGGRCKCWNKDEYWSFCCKGILLGKVWHVKECLGKELRGKRYELQCYGRSKDSRVCKYGESVHLLFMKRWIVINILLNFDLIWNGRVWVFRSVWHTIN